MDNSNQNIFINANINSYKEFIKSKQNKKEMDYRIDSLELEIKKLKDKIDLIEINLKNNMNREGT